MSTIQESGEDSRATEELVQVALAELDLPEDHVPATAAVVALQCRPTREVLDRACELCRSANADERRLGVMVLGELCEPHDGPGVRPAFVEESVEVLLTLAACESHVEVLAEVARALGYRRDPRAVPPLLAWRHHVDQPIRFHVACSLPRCCNGYTEAQVLEALIELSEDDDGAVRDYALFGPRELEADSAAVRDAMVRRVHDPDSSAAGEALLGLAPLKDERAVAPPIEYLQQPDPSGVIAYGANWSSLARQEHLAWQNKWLEALTALCARYRVTYGQIGWYSPHLGCTPLEAALPDPDLLIATERGEPGVPSRHVRGKRGGPANRRWARGYGWLTILNAEAATAAGGIDKLAMSETFYETKSLGEGAVLLQATAELNGYTAETGRRVFRELAHAIPPGPLRLDHIAESHFLPPRSDWTDGLPLALEDSRRYW